MLPRLLLCIAVLGMVSVKGAAAPGGQSPSAIAARCHHGTGFGATDDSRNRRAQAVALGKAVNKAEAEAVLRTRMYQPLSALGALPPVPTGFSLKLYADGEGYIFALKDTQDPCHFAIFSDTAGLLYEKNALTAPVIAQ